MCAYHARRSLLEERSYSTYRMRLEAHRRLQRTGWGWSLGLAAVTLSTLLASVAQLAYPDRLSRPTSVTVISLSAAALVASLVATQADHSLRARDMFGNYRRFQRISTKLEAIRDASCLDVEVDVKALEEEYQDSLDSSENHIYIDFCRSGLKDAPNPGPWLRARSALIEYSGYILSSTTIALSCLVMLVDWYV